MKTDEELEDMVGKFESARQERDGTWIAVYRFNNIIKFPQLIYSETDSQNRIREVEEKQAEIDRLMLEFCPNEMTPEQLANWAKHQRPAPAELQEVARVVFPSSKEE